jgi:hypothetical protein
MKRAKTGRDGKEAQISTYVCALSSLSFALGKGKEDRGERRG